MMRSRISRAWWLVVLVPATMVAACVGDDSSVKDSGVDATADGPQPEGSTDASDAGACDLDAAFQPATAVAGLTGLASVARFSADEKTAYFAQVVGDAGLQQLFVATRATLNDPFGAPTKLANVNDALGETTPYVSADGKTLFYAHSTFGATGRDIWYATRQDTIADFQNPQIVGIVNDPTHEDDYESQSSNGDLWFSSRRDVDASVNEIYHATYVGNGFGTPTIAAELNSLTENDFFPVLTGDLLRIFFQRAPSLTVWTAKRDVPSGAFGTPQVVNELTIASTIVRPAWASADGCRLYVGHGQPVDMFVAQRPPK